MASRFLCTTALEESWPGDRPILFLGEWCCRFTRRAHWEKLDAKVLPYHWDDRVKLQGDYLYLQELYARLLPELATVLNELHGVDRSLRYWRILVGLWLGYFVQILFDRWASIHQSIRDHDLSETVVLLDGERSSVPNDMTEFVQSMVGDEWNHHIYSAVLQQYTDVPISRQSWQASGSSREQDSQPSWPQRIKQPLAALISRLAGALVCDTDVFLHSTDLSIREETRLALHLRQLPQLWRFVPAKRASVASRNWHLKGESRSAFEAFARNMIPAQIPSVYIEGYVQLLQQTTSLPWPKHPKLIWTNNSQYTDDVFKAWSADKVDCGTPLAIGQHGGHLGVGRWSFIEEHDVAISDRYLSWGWSDPLRAKVTPVCQLQASRPLAVTHSDQRRALMVAGACPRFSYWMYSGIVARQWLDYFENQCAFVEHLPCRLRDVLTVRLYPQDYGWDQVARWSDRFPKLQLDSGAAKVDNLIRDCRVYISTYNATTYLQSLAMNVPTIIYWDPKFWELRDDATPYFDDLRRVGVFHDSAESAALHFERIWDDVDSWWSSTEVGEVLSRFKYRYCRAVPDIARCVETVLRTTIATAMDEE